MNADLAEWVNQLQATLSKMEVALGAIADAVVFLDVNSQVQWCNRAFVQLIERSHSTIIGSQFRELLPLAQAGVLIEPDTYPDVEMRKGGYEVAEYEFIQGDRRLILQISGSCTGVAEDNVAVLTIRDISDRKQTQIALADSEFKFRSIVQNTNDILVILTPEGVVRYISPNIINLTGYTATEVKSQSFEPFVHPDGVPKLWQAFNQVASTGGKLSGIEHRIRYKDGSWRWHRCNISAFEDTPGNWLIAIVGWDITARKQTEDALKTSQARLNTILSYTAASIIYYRVYSNREWHLDYYSPGSALIFGYSTEEMIADNQLVASHIHPEDWAVMYQDCFDKIFAEQTFEHNYRYLHPDGNWRWISAIFTSVWDQGINGWLVTSICTDITDKKNTEIALAESESKFRTIVENANDIILITDLEGVVRYISPNLETIMGYTPSELEGQSFEPIVHPDDLSKTWDAFNQLATTGERFSGLENRARHQDGSWKWFSSNLSAIRDTDGNLLFVSVARDITEHKQAEEGLKASEAKLNAILSSAVACIQRVRVYANRDWKYEYVSPGSELIYGYTPEEILADDYLLASRLHPQDLEAILPQIFESVFAEGSIGKEYRYLHPDGNWHWIFTTYTSVRNETEDCWVTTIVGTDITGRKQAEIALAESESKFRLIVENANDVIGIANLDGIVRYMSPNVVNWTGFTAAEMEGQSFEPFIHPDAIPKLYESFQQLATTGEKISGLEYRAKHKAGGYIWQLSNLSSFRDASGEFLIIGVVRDITERKQAEEALKASEARLNAILNSAVASIQRVHVYANQDWHLQYCSPGSELIYGYTTEEILADNNLITSRIHQEDWESVVPKIFDSIFSECPSENEYRYLHPDGDWRWISLNVTSVRNEAANCWMVTVIATDITVKKNTEIALYESEFKFRTIVENAGDVLCIVNLEGVIRYTSPNVVNLIGYTLAELEGQSFEPFIYADDVPKLQEAFQRLTKTGERISGLEYRNQHKDGRCLWQLANLSSFRDANGELLIIGVARDITERKQAEEALKASEARLNTILSSALAAIFQIRVDVNSIWEFEYVSEGSIHLWGFSPDELIADKTPFLERVVAKDLEAVHEATFEAIFAEGTFGGQYRYNHPDGSLRWISFQFSSARDAATNTWVVTNVAIDITDKKQAEAVLEYRARVERLLSNISRQFIDQDVDTAINFTLEAIAISSLTEFPPEATAEREIFQRQSIQSMLVVPMTHSDKIVGCLGVESVHCSKTWTQDDINLLKLVGELIAIGWARHKAEESLLVAKEAAEAANRAKSTFLANMSHELRTPLNAILGFAQLMEREPTLTSRQQEFLVIINRSGEHLLNLINDVLEMSKIEAGRIVLNPELINLPRLLQTLHDIFQVRTQAKELTLQFDRASNLPQYVLTDEGKLRQVLMNLLSNAVKFTETGGIILRARAGSREDPNSTTHTLYFEVEDTGKGIAPEEIGNLFQPFVQTTSGIQAREGTGLGLTISRQFVRLMGGNIQVSSILDQGSTFRFDIQVTLADTPPVEPTLNHGRVLNLAPNQPNYRILVVDDRPENRDLIAQLLDTVGFETRMAMNGQDAIQQWQEWHPHLIWMDMRMPIMDGYQATRQIRALETQENGTVTESNQPTIIIALTASAFEEQREHILAAGCDDFVRKPFREQVIFDKMAQYLGVGYIYAQDSQTKDTQTSTSGGDETILTADDLAVMPTAWVVALHQAAIEVDSDQILQLIEQIPERYVALIEGLTHWVDNFCFDEIIELIESIN